MENFIEYFSRSKTCVDFLNKLKNRGIKQAYIFNSFDEIKNYNFALIYSQILNCLNENKPCLTCSNCVKIQKQTAVDLFVYPKNASILVGDIENIIDTCFVLPNEFKYKIYILNEFDKANLSSQNKFLKTLEEPPEHVIFILTTSNLDKILDTIKSRCELINLPKIEENEFSTIFSRELNKNILENSYYEIGQCLKLTKTENFSSIFNFCLNLAENLNNSKQVLSFSSTIIKDIKNFETYYLCLTNIFRDLLAIKYDKKMIINKSETEKLYQISLGYNEQALNEILSYLLKVNVELNFNTNESLVVDCLLLKIVEEKVKWKKKL